MQIQHLFLVALAIGSVLIITVDGNSFSLPTSKEDALALVKSLPSVVSPDNPLLAGIPKAVLKIVAIILVQVLTAIGLGGELLPLILGFLVGVGVDIITSVVSIIVELLGIVL
nr:PREDICTED: uncharacterized protein LOC109031918 [Bemisia tabaci]